MPIEKFNEHVASKNPKILELGKFYFIHDQSPVGHPGYIIWKSDEKNLYLAIKIGSTPNDKNIPFGRPIGNGVEQSYFYKRAFLGKRKDYNKKELADMFISQKELLNIKEQVSFENVVYSKSINRKDKRFFRWLFKH